MGFGDEVGFEHPSFFSRAFSRKLGEKPSLYRKRQQASVSRLTTTATRPRIHERSMG
ncbi:AraC family transcriptional regulator [Rhizobium sp. C4]|uniref:AraC family transcriptional regulator n=1 Tax=Rhizobium sp. C4 TaxID=1349800 RepID=UPI003FA7BC69